MWSAPATLCSLLTLLFTLLVQQVWWGCLCHLQHLGLPNVSGRKRKVIIISRICHYAECRWNWLPLCCWPEGLHRLCSLFNLRCEPAHWIQKKNPSQPPIHHSLSSHLPPAGIQKSRHCLQVTPRTGVINSPPLSDDAALCGELWMTLECMWSRLLMEGGGAPPSHLFFFSVCVTRWGHRTPCVSKNHKGVACSILTCAGKVCKNTWGRWSYLWSTTTQEICD